MTQLPAEPLSQAAFDALFEQLKNWGRWGPDDQRGALNLITNQARLRGAALISEGFAISAAHPIPVTPGPNNLRPATRSVLAGGDGDGPGFSGAADQITIAPHGFATSHMDALCHIFWNQQMYNGYPAAKMTSRGAEANAIDVARDGVVSRGILLDIPRLLGKDFLAKGEAITSEDLVAAEERQGVRVEEGDVLLVRTGRKAQEQAEGETPFMQGAAGLHASAMPWLKERRVAVLGSDGVSDVIPSGCPVIQPVHALTLVALGVHLLDNLSLEPLAAACAARNRWAFQFVVAPLVLERGTGSAVNLLAIF
jgi:kynurenine formamidase